MKTNIWKHGKAALYATACAFLAVSVAYPVTPAQQIPSGKKANIHGSIVSRSGDLLKVKDKKDGSMVLVNLTDNTKIERKKSKVVFFRHQNMDVTAMVPGLTIDAEGTGNSKGQLDASKISFSPDEFAIEVAEEQQILANKSAAGKAQSTADAGVAGAKAAQSTANTGVADAQAAQSSANAAQSSANAAQSTANAGVAGAQAAGGAAVLDAVAIGRLNHRVSDLGSYQTKALAGIYFDTGKFALDSAAKADLDMLAGVAQSLDGYMIEIAGFASTTGTKQENQKLSEERASAVAQYLLVSKNIPMRRIVAPAGYGATHPDATNSDPQGRALNRRVDVAVVVNKGLDEDE
jgi:outer membrane protein OmpA-like peptidoglycan-associated protein